MPQERVSLGIAFVPQTQNVFTGMTVEENLEMGAFLRNDNIKETIDQIYDLFPILKEKEIKMLENYLEVNDNKLLLEEL